MRLSCRIKGFLGGSNVRKTDNHSHCVMQLVRSSQQTLTKFRVVELCDLVADVLKKWKHNQIDDLYVPDSSIRLQNRFHFRQCNWTLLSKAAASSSANKI